jgi:hypothetical protein
MRFPDMVNGGGTRLPVLQASCGPADWHNPCNGGGIDHFDHAGAIRHGQAVLTISSKNYGAWALRGWLMARLAGLDFTEKVIPPDDPAMKAEMLLLSPSMLVPSLQHNGVKVWDTLAIGEYLNEIKPKAGLLPADMPRRGRTAGRSAARCIRASARCAARCP